MLSPAERKILKQRAHHLNPVVRIGQKGLREAVHLEITSALLAHELIKIDIAADSREDRALMIAEIGEAHGAELIQAIGHIAVFYRKNEE